MIKAILLVFLAEVACTIGQIFFKKGTDRIGRHDFKTWNGYLAFAKKILELPIIWFGLMCMGINLVFWLMALSESDLSIVFPLSSMQYIFVPIACRLFLHEKIDRMKLVGTFLVVIGILIIAIS